MSVELRFSHPASGASPVELRFGSGGESQVIEGVLVADLPVEPVSLSIEIDAAQILDLPDNAGPVLRANQAQGLHRHAGLSIGHKQTIQRTIRAEAFSARAERLAQRLGLLWKHQVFVDRPFGTAHAAATIVTSSASWAQRDLAPSRHRLAHRAAGGTRRQAGAGFSWADKLRLMDRAAVASAHASPVGNWLVVSANQGAHIARRLGLRWAQMVPLPVGFFTTDYVPPPGPDSPQPDFAELRFRWPAEVWGKLRFGVPFFVENTIPIRRVYVVIPDVIVTRVSTGEEIDCAGLTLTFDADSHSWAGQLQLVGSNAIAALEPDGNQPVVLNAHVNGYDWRLIADRWGESVAFGSRGIRVSARGITAALCEPWTSRVAGTVASSQTVQQVFQGLLPFGWTVDWLGGVSPWMVPAGAWSWSGAAPLPTIHQAAQALGLMIRPDRTSQQFDLLPRYPILPWNYAAATPDHTVPLEPMTGYERSQPIATQANAVFAHGAEPGGVIGQVVILGTAGDQLAETISHPLITHIGAARVAGGRVLAGRHQTPEWQGFTLPLGGPDFPLINVGDLVQIETPGDPRALASAVQISVRPAGRGISVRQQITLGEDTPNEYRRFRQILPADPTYLAEVISSTGQTSLVELLAGDRVRVQGTETPGQMVYINAGRIIAQAPTLPASLINI